MVSGIVPARDEPASRGVPEAYRGEPIRIEMRIGEPGRNRTYNQQIKSLLLCQLSYGPSGVRRPWGRHRSLVAHGERRNATGKPKL